MTWMPNGMSIVIRMSNILGAMGAPNGVSIVTKMFYLLVDICAKWHFCFD
jgi:hypothetical protein